MRWPDSASGLDVGLLWPAQRAGEPATGTGVFHRSPRFLEDYIAAAKITANIVVSSAAPTFPGDEKELVIGIRQSSTFELLDWG